MRHIKAILAAASALAATLAFVFAQPASAQDMPDWWSNSNSWDGPRRFRAPPAEYRRPYREDVYSDDGDWREDRRRYRRWREEPDYGARDDGDWRGDTGGEDTGRDETGRDDDGRERRRGVERRERDEQNAARDDDQDQDSARWPAEEGDPSTTQGVYGGGRPNIAGVAPPQIRFNAGYAPGSIVIDTSARKLYYVTSATSAYAYSIGVGREGFAWTGSEKVSRIQDWPDWYPPKEMRTRKPELPERMLGGLNNPLGAKAIYLGNTLYRIHGTNDPRSIGKAESSGCFRMLNQNVLHLASLVQTGTPVTVVKSLPRGVASAASR